MVSDSIEKGSVYSKLKTVHRVLVNVPRARKVLFRSRNIVLSDDLIEELTPKDFRPLLNIKVVHKENLAFTCGVKRMPWYLETLDRSSVHYRNTGGNRRYPNSKNPIKLKLLFTAVKASIVLKSFNVNVWVDRLKI